jgi:hypothetical protein
LNPFRSGSSKRPAKPGGAFSLRERGGEYLRPFRPITVEEKAKSRTITSGDSPSALQP